MLLLPVLECSKPMYDVLECEKHNTAALLFRVCSVSL